MPILLDVNLILLIIGVLSPSSVFIARYFWRKERCFTALQSLVNKLTESDKSSDDTHVTLTREIKEIKNKQTKNEIYLKLLLDNAGIKYD